MVRVGLLVMVTVLIPFASSSLGEPVAWAAPAAPSWPPPVGAFFPPLPLTDLSDRPASLARLHGKVVLLELIGVPCSACNALAGGHEHGGYRGVRPQPGVQSLEKQVARFAKTSAHHPELAIVQLLLYGSDGRPGVSRQDARGWVRHFQLDRRGHTVLRGEADFARRVGKGGIPALYLIDRNGILRARAGKTDASRYTELLPMLGRLLTSR